MCDDCVVFVVIFGVEFWSQFYFCRCVFGDCCVVECIIIGPIVVILGVMFVGGVVVRGFDTVRFR